uniref:Uncharacterized protein n=1 Tax=Arundo donax TaxID=35708 RepID=A0A0A9ENL7_ARUDO
MSLAISNAFHEIEFVTSEYPVIIEVYATISLSRISPNAFCESSILPSLAYKPTREEPTNLSPLRPSFSESACIPLPNNKF